MLQMQQPKITNSNPWPQREEQAPPPNLTGLTAPDVAALAELVPLLAGSWECEFHDEDAEGLAAHLIPRDWADGNAAAFVIARAQGNFLLTDRRMTADFGNTSARREPQPAAFADRGELVQRLIDAVGRGGRG
jgi:hypothetical protein